VQHLPVLLNTCIQELCLDLDGRYIDATFGRGGHTQALLNHLSAQAQIHVIDQDPDALVVAHELAARDNRVKVHAGSFHQLIQWIKIPEYAKQFNGILFDLGVSSPQLDNAQRGFSFLHEGPLDMRMDPTQGISAAQWIAKINEKDLADTIYQYGEERLSRRIARAICEQREKTPFTTTTQLADCIKFSVPPPSPKQRHRIHAATRTFQAIRIVVNQELTVLEQVLPATLELLKPGGRLLVMSFHSLEDRIVKHFMRDMSKKSDDPTSVKLKRIAKIQASDEEIKDNPRARSVMLRVAEKM